MSTANQVSSLYKTVVDDVINNVKEAFLDEGVDEQVLQELRQLWETKLSASKAMEPANVEAEVHLTSTSYPLILQQSQPQALHQGYVPRGVLATAAQQPQQTFPVSITNQARELSGAAAAATMALPVGLFQHQIAALGAGQAQNVTLQPTGNGHFIVQNLAGGAAVAQGLTATITIPQQTFVQSQSGQHVTNIAQVAAPNQSGIIQLDGTGDTSSSEDEDFDNDENDDDNEEEQNDDDAEQGEEEEPLNSADDVSEEDPTELFDAENVVVCQYDKINRNKNKWKFTLKDGIMNLNGRDFVFQKASGDAEW